MAKKAKSNGADQSADEIITLLTEDERFFWWKIAPKNKKTKFEVAVGVESENKREKPSYYSGVGETIGEAYTAAIEAFEEA